MSDRFGYGEIGLDINPCRGCEGYDELDGCKSNGGCGKPITNADRIRNMDDYDLAIFLENVSCKYADTESWMDWLKQEVR